jgi:flagellin-specific chaperone FliS
VRISKPVHGIMEIAADSNNGVVWINSCDGQCILRICKLKFKKIEAAFSSIDITDSQVYMESNLGNEYQEDLSNFLSSVYETIIRKLVEKPIEKQKEFLISILDNIKEFIQEEQ